MTKNLILSLFPGIDGLGIGFERHGYCVVRGPDKITGGDVREFKAVAGFEGVIAGPPCQGFSKLNRNPDQYSHEMLDETIRVILEAAPDWFLIENVEGVPDVAVDGYITQRFVLDLAWFSDYGRKRVFQFGSVKGVVLNPMYKPRGKVKRGAVTCSESVGVEVMRDIHGFPSTHALPCMHRSAKKRAYGNAVPIQLAQYVAGLIRGATGGTVAELKSKPLPGRPAKRCACGCGRELIGRQKRFSSGTCRVRGHRKGL